MNERKKIIKRIIFISAWGIKTSFTLNWKKSQRRDHI